MAERVPVINVYPIGSIGEENAWEIHEDVTASDQWGTRPCPHAVNYRHEPAYARSAHSNPPPMVHRWEVPRTILIYNQGRNDSTEVCVECVLEALQPMTST